MVERALTKVTKTCWLVGCVTWNVNMEPAVGGVPGVAVNAGKAVNGRGELLDGQEVMKPEAREKTALAPRGVPRVVGDATRLMLSRWAEVWRASVTRMEAATPRIAGEEMRPAAPR